MAGWPRGLDAAQHQWCTFAKSIKPIAVATALDVHMNNATKRQVLQAFISKHNTAQVASMASQICSKHSSQ
jgi:hypothetical protein